MGHWQWQPEERNEIRTFCEERFILEVVHFTAMENLPTIHQHGLLSRRELEARQITYRYTDSNRYDGINNICLSISFPNYQMFYSKRTSSSFDEFAVLSLKPRLLWELRCYFCPTNAAKREISLLLQQDPSQFVGLEALRKLFADEAMTPNGVIKRADLKIPREYTTDPQAEVLCYQPIPSDFIRKIYVHSDNSQAVKQVPPEWQCLMFHNDDFFKWRQDHKHWKKAG